MTTGPVTAGLLSPLSVANLRLRNRIVMPPLASGKATEDGRATRGNVEYHRLRAAAGTGLVIVEHSYVHPRGRYAAGQMGVHDDATVEGLARVAAAIRDEGAAACLQLAHAGMRAVPADGSLPAGPSAVPFPGGDGAVPEALDEAGIATVVAAFGDAAARAVQAGFDAVEVHGAHGFLLSQFASPLTNRRQDAWGGDEAGRGRIHEAVVAEVRRRVGPGVALLVRLGACDEMEGGLSLEAGCRLAVRLVAAGADVLDVSGGLQGARPAWHEGRAGYYAGYATAVRAATGVPVIATGGIDDPRFADALVREGRADLVGVGRAMLKDAGWSARAIRELQGA